MMSCTNFCANQPCPTPWACAEEGNKLALEMHRVSIHSPLTPEDVTDKEYEDEVSVYGKGAFWAAVVLVALVASLVLVGSFFSDNWPQLVALLS